TSPPPDVSFLAIKSIRGGFGCGTKTSTKRQQQAAGKGRGAKMEEGLEGEHDWLFDVMTEYLGSAEFNDAIMDFVDEHCDLFKNEEENKLIHTDIHNEFKEHVRCCRLLAVVSAVSSKKVNELLL